MPRRSHLALRYLTRFQCIGPACEENCCGGWRVDVDEGHYQKLRRAMSKSPEDKARFEAMTVREPAPTRSRYRFAVLKDRSDGKCMALGADGWCDLHRRFGEPILPHTCAVYPRHQITVGARVELSANISCPEVARLALLADDAVDLVEVNASMVVREDDREKVITPETAILPWVRHFDDVRGTALQILSSAQYPVATRLLHLSALAYDLQGLLTPDGQMLHTREVQALLDLSMSVATRDRLHQELASAETTALGASIVTNLISGIRRHTLRTSFQVVLGYAVTDCGAGALTPSLLHTTHMLRREKLPLAVRERMERYFENFHRHFWMREMYLASPSLHVYIQNEIVRHCFLRFLLIGHPLTAAAANETDEARQRELLDKAAVEVFYTYSRGLDHNADLWHSITKDLADRGLQSLPHGLAMLKF